MDKVNKTYQISSRIYDLIYELNVICPSILLQVLPQLECKLKAGAESDRLSKSIHNSIFILFVAVDGSLSTFSKKKTSFFLFHLQRPLHCWRVCSPRKVPALQNSTVHCGDSSFSVSATLPFRSVSNVFRVVCTFY